MDNVLSALLLILLLGSGIYALYIAIRLKKTYTLFDSKFLYPANCAPKDCVDVEGFISYMLPRMLTLGLVCTVMGILFALSAFAGVIPLPQWVELYLIPACGLAPFIWVTIAQSKAAKLYW